MKLKELAKKGLCLCLSAATLAGVCSLSGCSGREESGGKLVKLSVCVSDMTPAARALKEVFEPRVEELTGGRYNVQVYTSGVLGAEKVTYDYTRSGIIELCMVGTPMWSETPKMSIPDFPFVFRDVEHARRCYQGELGDYIAEDIESSQPVQLMSWFPNNPIYVRLAESLGANVVIMDMGEVFTALEQGVADGQDNPLATVRNEGWYEVQDYAYLTNHIIASLELFASDEFWDSLSEEDQKSFAQAAEEASDYAWDLYIEQLEDDEQFMKDEGLTVTEMSEEERQQMLEMIQPVYDYLDSQYEWAPEVRQMIADIE